MFWHTSISQILSFPFSKLNFYGDLNGPTMDDAIGENTQITNNVEKNGSESRQEAPGGLKMWVD